MVIFVCSEETIEGTAIQLDDINKVSPIRGWLILGGPRNRKLWHHQPTELAHRHRGLDPKAKIRGIPQILPLTSYIKMDLWAQ